MSRLGRTFKAGRANIPPYYHPTSFWNRPLGPSDTLAVDQTPAAGLANTINSGRQPGQAGAPYTFQGYTGPGYSYNYWPWGLGYGGPANTSCPVYYVRPSDPKQNITWQKVQCYYTSGGVNHPLDTLIPDVAAKMATVPIPDKTKCPLITGTGDYVDLWSGASGDQSCAIINLDTGECYEMLKFRNDGPADMQAFGGCTWTSLSGQGYIPNVATFNGAFQSLSGLGGTFYKCGAGGCGIGLLGGFITMQDLRNVYRGEAICHAIGIDAPWNIPTSSVPSAAVAPANRSDGFGGNNAGNGITTIPSGWGFPNQGQPNPAFGFDSTHESQRFRFPSNVDLSGCTLALARGIAQAIRDYGLYIVNTSSGCVVGIEDIRTVGSPYHAQGARAVNPFADLDWTKVQSAGAPYNAADPRGLNVNTGFSALHQIPWGQLQLLNPVTG